MSHCHDQDYFVFLHIFRIIKPSNMKEGEIVLNGRNFSWESVLQHIPSDGAKCPSTPNAGMDWRVGHSIMMEAWREMPKFQYFYNLLQPPPFHAQEAKMFVIPFAIPLPCL
jgi:hypothetical protein